MLRDVVAIEADDSLAGDTEFVHATCIAVGGRAVLITGASGHGKSDLALRVIMTRWAPALCHAPPELVADDQVRLWREDDVLMAGPPAPLAGRIEIRGVGILEVPYCPRAEVRLVAEIVAGDRIPRLPDAGEHTLLQGVSLPRIAIDASEPSAPIKLLAALARSC